MRLRHKPWAKEYIENKKKLFIQENELAILEKMFPVVQKINLEIGIGKGDFIIQQAMKNPQINYIGVELQPSVIVIAAQKLEKLDLPNVKLLCIDVFQIAELVNNQNFIETIYLNFSDPWPKKRHEKRRLTSDEFLLLYKKLLIENGTIELKTDNDKFFEYSLMSFWKNNWFVEEFYLDLHSEEKENSVTEFEKRFSSQGIKIKYLKVRKND